MSVTHRGFDIACNGCGKTLVILAVTQVAAREEASKLGWVATSPRASDGTFRVFHPTQRPAKGVQMLDACGACAPGWQPPFGFTITRGRPASGPEFAMAIGAAVRTDINLCRSVMQTMADVMGEMGATR